MGYGKEGKAAEQYFRQRGDEVEVFKEVTTAELDKIDFSCYNEIMRSPSVRPRDRFSSVTKYFFQHCPAPIIGVTGTKGKGTTCSMIAELLKALGRKVFLVGNIGVPAIDKLDEITAEDVVVYELSSFQLWDLTQSPQVAVVLRIAPDHLNVHKDFAEYVAAKANIARFQKKGDSVVYFRDNAAARAIAEESAGTKIPYPAAKPSQKRSGLLDALTVPGAHNREDAEAALAAVAAFLNVPLSKLIRTHFEELKAGLAAFKGLPHHIELVRELNGVAYYDDSFSTAEPALEVALAAFPAQPIVLIAGGQDKGVDLTETKRIIFGAPNLQQVFLLGEIAQQLAKGEDAAKYTIVDSLDAAVQGARKVAEEIAAGKSTAGKSVAGENAAGKIVPEEVAARGTVARKNASGRVAANATAPRTAVAKKAAAKKVATTDPAVDGDEKRPVVLLSPGAASLDMFSSYYERGEVFQRLVKELK